MNHTAPLNGSEVEISSLWEREQVLKELFRGFKAFLEMYLIRWSATRS